MQTDSPRLAYLIDSLKRAGTQRALVNLAEGLAARGWQQRVYCLNDAAHPDIVSQLEACGVDVIVVGKAQIAALIGLVHIWRDFRRWQPAVVQTFLPFGDLIGRTLARLAGVPALVTSIRARNIDKRRWQLWLDRRTMPWADKVIFNTKHAIPFAMENEGVREAQAVYIPNGVKLKQATPSEAAALRAQLGVPENTRVIGTVGRLAWQKGQTHLLRAFARLAAAQPDLVLWVVGMGELREALEAEATQLGVAGQVHFLGERRDVPVLLAAMDLYVHPSIFEGMPNAVMEAMAAGLPVIATQVDGARELITPGETGWLVPPGDAEALTEQITRALANPAEAAQVGARAARHMATRFAPEQMITAYDRLYRRLLAQTRGKHS